LLINACLFLGVNDLPELRWRHRPGLTTSGCCGKTRITVRAGRDRTDTKLVILHEVAHFVTPDEVRETTLKGVIDAQSGKEIGDFKVTRRLYHTDTFWDTAWRLYRWAKIPVRYALQREGEYKAGAVLAYRRSRKGER
jgi:hypothetical protein